MREPISYEAAREHFMSLRALIGKEAAGTLLHTEAKRCFNTNTYYNLMSQAQRGGVMASVIILQKLHESGHWDLTRCVRKEGV